MDQWMLSSGFPGQYIMNIVLGIQSHLERCLWRNTHYGWIKSWSKQCNKWILINIITGTEAMDSLQSAGCCEQTNHILFLHQSFSSNALSAYFISSFTLVLCSLSKVPCPDISSYYGGIVWWSIPHTWHNKLPFKQDQDLYNIAKRLHSHKELKHGLRPLLWGAK